MISFVAHLLKERFKLTGFQSCDQGREIGFDSKLVDRHRQLKATIEIDHFSVLQYLLATAGEFLPRSLAFHLVNIVQQWLYPAELANQRRGGLAAKAGPGNV